MFKKMVSCIEDLKNRGFTLAEVLITLTIIGVVAALTIPTSVRNYQKQQTVVKLKKVYSILNQAYNQSQAENGMYQTWETGFEMGSTAYFNTYWKPYLKVAKICANSADCNYARTDPCYAANGNLIGLSAFGTHGVSFILQDGTFMQLRTTGGNLTALETTVYVDLNNSNLPNKFGRDVFYFRRTEKGVLPGCYSNSECSKTGQGQCCAGKIMNNGWEIKDDYPW